MPFRMMRRCLGTASLAGFPWLMAWHDCSVNLGLQWGCRPVPAVRRRLFCQVLLWLIWQSSPCFEASYQGSDTALDQPQEGYPVWISFTWWGETPKAWWEKSTAGQRQEAAQRQRIRWQQEIGAGGHRATKPSRIWKYERLRWHACSLWEGNSSPFNLHFIEQGGCNLEALGELRQVPLILLLSALMRRLHTPSF